MAMEVCSENCCGVSSSISPRISFSHDFSQSDLIPVEQQQHPFGSDPSFDDNLNQNTDFDFCVTESFDLESLPAADEFFSDGRILPTDVKASKYNTNNSLLKPKGQLLLAAHPPPPPPPLPPPCVVKNHNHYNGFAYSSSKSLKKDHSYREGKYFNNDEVCDKKQQNSGSSKSFWSFKRSSSCGNGYRRSLCPLPLLSRSNSTGSTSPEPEFIKRNSLSKESHNNNNNSKQNSQKHSSSFTRCSSPSTGPNIYQKPPLNHSKNGSYGNSVRVSPALNVHSANLFGLGSIFSNSRDKSKKKVIT